MPPTILATKLFAPPHRPDLVPRGRLFERLDAGAEGRLTLLSAPAGFGKTTLVSEWAAARDRRVAWLSLEAADGDLPRFLAHVVAALQTALPGVGEEVAAALHAPGPPPTEALLTELVNGLAGRADEGGPAEVVLVLDDYHEVDSEAVDGALGFLLEHLPPNAHLVLTTREDPSLRLARLRARGQLTELRAADLRFTPDEAAAFLNDAMGLSLSEEDVAALEARTEGWIAGLQLAALSVRGREDASGFIRAFAGDHRYVVDYLVEEVLERQPGRVRAFLLRTSVLRRLSAPLCDAVTGESGSEGVLEGLERANLFLVPLDDRRRWYRFHQLFADVLRAHLAQELPDEVPQLHARASAWFEAQGSVPEAVHHAFAGDDLERAARLIAASWRAMDAGFESAAWLAWVRRLPASIVRERPALGAGYAWALLNEGEMEAADERVREVEAALESGDASGDGAPGFPSVPATVASARAYHALSTGDPAASVAHARRALELFPESDAVGRGVPLGVLGLAHWANGDLDDAYRITESSMAGFRAAGVLVAALAGTFALADLRLTQGRLRDAAGLYEESFAYLAEHGSPVLPSVAELHVGLAEVRREQGDVAAAEEHLRVAAELGDRAVLPGDQARLGVAIARIEAGLGRADRALERLDEAERRHVRNPMPALRPVAAIRARFHLALGRVADARAWAEARELPPDEAPRYLREYEQVTVARVLLADPVRTGPAAGPRQALALLERLLAAAEAGGRVGSALEILVLQALAHDALGDASAAQDALGRALTLAEPEGHVAVFLDEGAAMPALLRQAAKRGAGHARRLLAHAEGAVARAPAAAGSATASGAAGPEPIEPLTDREGDVLRLLGSEMSGPEIARELHVSLNTLRTHIKNIYGKLGVNSRRTAVRRARELDLL